MESCFGFLYTTERSNLRKIGSPHPLLIGLMIWPGLVTTLGMVSFWKALWMVHVNPVGSGWSFQIVDGV